MRDKKVVVQRQHVRASIKTVESCLDTVMTSFEARDYAGLERATLDLLQFTGTLIADSSHLRAVAVPRTETGRVGADRCECGAPLPLHLFRLQAKYKTGTYAHVCGCGRQWNEKDGKPELQPGSCPTQEEP